MNELELVQVDYFRAEIAKIEKALTDPDNVENHIYLSNSPRKDLITRWAECLEELHKAGEYNNPLNTISSYISERFREWKMDKAVHYVREVLDFKYKNPSQMRGDTENDYYDDTGEVKPREDSSILSAEVKRANQKLIIYMERTIKELKNNIGRLSKDIFLESVIPIKESEMMFLNWDHIIKRHQEAYDGREKVPATLQHIMAYCLSAYSMNHAYTKFVKYAIEDTALTEKQASKMARLQTNKVDKLFDPKSFMEAKELGFYGQQCDTCGSWRTESRHNPDANKDQLYCFDIHDDKLKPQWSKLQTMKIEDVEITDNE